MKKYSTKLIKIVLIIISLIILILGVLMKFRESEIVECNDEILQMYGEQESITKDLVRSSTESLYLKLHEIREVLFCHQYTSDKKGSKKCEKDFSDKYGDLSYEEWQKTYPSEYQFIESNKNITKKISECNRIESKTNWPFILLIILVVFSVIIEISDIIKGEK